MKAICAILAILMFVVLGVGALVCTLYRKIRAKIREVNYRIDVLYDSRMSILEILKRWNDYGGS